MHSSIFSFDFSAIAKIVGTAAATILLAWAVVPGELPYDEQPVPGAEPLNELIVERYIYEAPHKPVVMLGSSILTMIPPSNCRPDNVASIYLQAGSAITGLEVIRRVGARPSVVFVEVTTAIMGEDAKLLGTVFIPLYWRIRLAVPPLRHNRNWLVLLYRLKAYERLGPAYSFQWPSQGLAQWNEARAAHIAPILQVYGYDYNIDPPLAELTARVRELRHAGTRVIFYDSADPRVRAISWLRNLREKLKAAFPGVEMIEAPEEEAPMYRWDGLHFVDASGLWFFNYLMRRAGIPFTPKCELVPRAPGPW
jgi:hypothetical protein